MPTLSRSAAEPILDPILSLIEQCFSHAWEQWDTFYQPVHHVLDARARASIVYCHVVDHAMVVFKDVPNVTPGKRRGLFRLYVGNEIALRFKKAKRDGTTSNIGTRQQRLIDLQIKIPGILPGTMLNAVYQLDDLQRDIERMMVTHQLDGKVQWSVEIKRPGETLPIPMPAPSDPPSDDKRARVRGPRTAKKAEGEEK